MDITVIEELLKRKQNTKRYRHTLGVQYTSMALAMVYGEDLERASLAGLLHDCAKHMSEDKLYEKAKKYDLPISKVEKKNPFLLHGKVGAALAEKKYGITDQGILNAIWYHTTGRPEMTLLEKIVFVADYIEPGRKNAPNLPELRKLAFENLDLAVLETLKQTLDYLKDGGGDIDPQTELTYNYYNDLLNKQEA